MTAAQRLMLREWLEDVQAQTEKWQDIIDPKRTNKAELVKRLGSIRIAAQRASWTVNP